MKKLWLISVLLPFCLGALEITECRPGGGKTLVAWKNAPAEYVMIYRYSEKITPQNIFFAVRQRCRAADGSCLIVPKSGGQGYYMVTSCDKFGRETRDYTIQAGPVDENPAYTLPPVDFSVRSDKQGTRLVWEPLPLEIRGMSRTIQLKNKAGKVIEQAPVSATEFRLPAPQPGKSEFYTVCIQDVNGRDSAAKSYFCYGDFPDFMIDGQSNVVKNQDVFLSTRYPVTGRENRIAFRISNCGGKAGSAEVTLPGVIREKISLAPGESVMVAGNWQPEKSGKHQLALNIAADSDRQLENNSLLLQLHAADKPLHFIWYGNAAELDHATAGTDNPEHWKRVGGKRLHICVKSDDISGYHKILDSTDAPDGLQYDELGGNIEPEKYISVLRQLRKTHPQAFIALWHIGANLKPEIVEALKDGTIDLVMPERYHTFNAPMEESLKKDINMLRRVGVLDKTIIGLGTHRNYAGFGSAEDHAAYLEKQIALIRKLAPESPGMAFFSAATLPGLKEKVDDMCRKYFLEADK